MVDNRLKLTTENSKEYWRFKIGTYTPVVVWVHKDDYPIEEGNYVRYTKQDLEEDIHEDHYAEADIGYVQEIRDNQIEKVCFIRPGGIISQVFGDKDE